MARGRYLKGIWQGKACVLCGGMRAAEGREHAPPKVMFKDPHRPVGMEVPACSRCNNGSGALDQMVAFFAMSSAPKSLLQTQEMSNHEHKIARGTVNNASSITADKSSILHISATPVPLPGHLGHPTKIAYAVELKPDVIEGIAKWAAKQALAIWYLETGKIASHRATINVHVLTNVSQPSEDLKAWVRHLGITYTLGEGRQARFDEFSYQFSAHPTIDAAIIFAQYHGGLAFISVLSDRKGAALSHKQMRFRFRTNGHRGIYRA